MDTLSQKEHEKRERKGESRRGGATSNIYEDSIAGTLPCQTVLGEQ